MITGLKHVVLMCADTDVSRAWYEMLGFRYLQGFGGMHWFALGDGDLMLHPADRRVAAGSVGLHAAVADVDALFRHISTEGLQPFDHQQPGIQIAAPVTREWGDREFELLDPDGYRWAFTQET